ncbi:MAG: carboxymuconolactone decarboxylase family protein [Deltaproteobacteria bacterium]|nr:carboxymuconolactone decarboxylase family protein [Deltaproteobacteria bacterium]
MTTQIPLPDFEKLPDETKKVLEASPLNVFFMMANAPASFNSLAKLANSILRHSSFDPRKREIAVLRIAQVTNSIYEWTHHVEVAKRCGVKESEIEIIKTENPVHSLGEEGNLLCRVADEISNNVRLSDEALGQIIDLYGVRGATELILCVSYFNMISRFLESTRVPLEDDAEFKKIHQIPGS